MISLVSNTNRNGNWYEKEIGKNILKGKYFHNYLDNKEDLDGLIKRLEPLCPANTGLRIKELFLNADFMPAGSILYGAGMKEKGVKASLSNCYILRSPEDNLEDIFQVCKEMARIFSYRGGCGINLSKLRPRGAIVNNAALTSTGAVSFMKIFDATSEVIGANGRRSALILGLECSHPDIEEFIEVKANDTEIQKANISILFTKEFMEAVEKNRLYTLSYTLPDGVFEKTINAREFFMKMAEKNRDWGEPGCLFIDRIREWNYLSAYPEEEYNIEISNPCVVGDTLILTKDGYVPIEEVVGKTLEIWNGYEWSEVTPKITGENQEVMKINFSNGTSLTCTPYHKFYLKDGSLVEAKDLEMNDQLRKWDLPIITRNLGGIIGVDEYTQGFFSGDGSLENNERGTNINPNRDASHFVYVESIEKIEDKVDKVYCFNEPKNHTALFNGVVTGQCAEYVGNEYNSCNLSSINLYNCVSNPFTHKALFDFEKFGELVQYGVEFLDNVLDYGYDSQPLEQNKKCIDDWRAIGLGIFGLADMFIAMGITYGSAESITLCNEIFKVMQTNALIASNRLAINKKPFGKFDYNKYSKSAMYKNIISELNNYDDNSGTQLDNLIKKFGVRNASLLSIAPTGSIATMCGLSGGAEPLFAISYNRTTHALEKEKKFFKVYGRAIEDLLIHNNISLDNITDEEILKKFPYITVSHYIKPFNRVALQSQIQKYVDNAISSTVNLPEKTSTQEVFDLYINAFKMGCKGLTVFRNNCLRSPIMVNSNEEKPIKRVLFNKEDEESIAKGSQELEDSLIKEMIKVVNVKKEDSKINSFLSESLEQVIRGETTSKVYNLTPIFNTVTPLKRKNVEVVSGNTYVLSTACVPKMYVTVNRMEGNLFEVFVNVSNGCTSNIGTIARMVSMAARSGVKESEIIKELRANICPACTVTNAKGIKVETSCGAAVAKAIEMDATQFNIIKIKKEVIEESTKTPWMEKESIQTWSDISNAECPECGEATLVPTGKCNNCYNCGYSKCD